MKPEIQFRAVSIDDYALFQGVTGYWPGPQFGGIVAYHDHTIMGIVGLDGWTPRSVTVHWYIRQPRCIMPLWRELLAYLQSHGKRKLLGSIKADNHRCLRMIFGRLGWHEILRIKDGWDTGIDLVIAEYNIHEHGQVRANPVSAVRSAA